MTEPTFGRQFQVVFQHSPIGIVVMDGSGRIQYANLAVGRFLQAEPDDLVGGFLTSFSHQEDSEFFQTLFAELIEGDRDEFQVVSRCRIGNGETAWWRVDMRAVRIPESVPFMLAVVDDVTSQKTDEERLRRAKELAEAATRTKSAFLANMSHEIRTPLHTINGMAELMRDTNLDEEQLEYLRQIEFAGEVLLGLINDILDFSKIEAGRLQLEHINFDPVRTIEDAVDMVSMQAHRKGLEVVLYVDDQLPRTAFGDPNRLRQVLVNLVNNAVKFTEKGTIRVSAESRSRKGMKRIIVQVKDSGIGIPEDRQDRLFQPFSQVDASMTRKFGGTGLGLSISRDLISMMNGRIGVKSKQGVGSNFWFTLPLDMPSADTVAEAPPEATRSGLRALVVDDAQESASVIAAYLKRWSAEVQVVRSAGEALRSMTEAMVAGNGYDLALIDLRLPDMDGWQMASEVRNDPVLEKTPLVLMSPSGLSTGDAKMKLLRWFDAYINKPVKMRELVSALETIYASDIEELEAIDPAVGASVESKPTEIVLPETVLVSEDHFVNQQLFQTILEKKGFRTIVASDGLEAVAAMEANPDIGLVFMDVQMPNLNGYDATTRIRELGFKTPIIAVTANALSGDRDRCIRVGMNEYMSKPFKKTDIDAAIDRLIAAGHFSGDPGGSESVAGSGGSGGFGPAVGAVTPGEDEGSPGDVPREQVHKATEPKDDSASGGAPGAQGEATPIVPEKADGRDGFDEDEDIDDIDEIQGFDEMDQDRGGGDSSSREEDGEAPIDLVQTVEAFMGDAETAERVVRKFADRLDEQIGQVQGYLDEGKIADARVVAHAIKGGSWNLHAQVLGNVAKAVEDACADEDSATANTGLDPLRAEAARFQAYVAAFDFSTLSD